MWDDDVLLLAGGCDVVHGVSIVDRVCCVISTHTFWHAFHGGKNLQPLLRIIIIVY